VLLAAIERNEHVPGLETHQQLRDALRTLERAADEYTTQVDGNSPDTAASHGAARSRYQPHVAVKAVATPRRMDYESGTGLTSAYEEIEGRVPQAASGR
jgi:hypothetical protein